MVRLAINLTRKSKNIAWGGSIFSKSLKSQIIACCYSMFCSYFKDKSLSQSIVQSLESPNQCFVLQCFTIMKAKLLPYGIVCFCHDLYSLLAVTVCFTVILQSKHCQHLQYVKQLFKSQINALLHFLLLQRLLFFFNIYILLLHFLILNSNCEIKLWK